jgi:rSAM/selenodomain-associated transferase 1
VRDLLLVFLKEPRPGAVKTRLVPLLGETMAAELYRVMAEEELRRTAPAGAEYARMLFFTPPEGRDAVEAWLPGEECAPQSAGDLGARMASAFADAFGRGAQRVTIIGTDAPAVDRGTVLEAFAALQDHDLVLGPAKDGGYYLIGLERPRPELFGGIAWSTPGVFPTTMERAAALGLRVRLLEPLRDIDTPEDLRAERARLEPLLRERPGLRQAIAAAYTEDDDAHS